MITRRGFIGFVLGVAAMLGHILPARVWAAAPRRAQKVDDASGLNGTPVAEIVNSADHETLRAALKRAHVQGLKIAAGRVRHSMGGQAIPGPGGMAIEMPQQDIVIGADGKSYTAGAGTSWHTIIRQLNERGLSPAVMQSNDDFSVGGTLSVNAHGWPAAFGPFGSTVRSFRMMLADGTVKNCSRTENAELFSLTVGGYGLMGIILDAELDAVPNSFLKMKQKVLPAEKFAEYFTDALKSDPSIRMAYGRMSVSSDNFLTETIASTAHEIAAPAEGMPTLRTEAMRNAFLRSVYMMQKDSDWGKRTRWQAEKQVASGISLEFSRNNLLYTPVKVFQNKDAARTDILHEYFVPPERFNDFIQSCRAIIPQHGQELMNVTLRYVKADTDSTLRYAPDERLCLVMLFLQKKDAESEQRMEAMTRALIDAALDCGGNYYLPYRLHATHEQFHRAYPGAASFFEKKAKYDPAGLFSNALAVKYGPK
jgi:FAD/FMN-containing dehydrogenase